MLACIVMRSIAVLITCSHAVQIEGPPVLSQISCAQKKMFARLLSEGMMRGQGGKEEARVRRSRLVIGGTYRAFFLYVEGRTRNEYVSVKFQTQQGSGCGNSSTKIRILTGTFEYEPPRTFNKSVFGFSRIDRVTCDSLFFYLYGGTWYYLQTLTLILLINTTSVVQCVVC